MQEDTTQFEDGNPWASGAAPPPRLGQRGGASETGFTKPKSTKT